MVHTNLQAQPLQVYRNLSFYIYLTTVTKMPLIKYSSVPYLMMLFPRIELAYQAVQTSCRNDNKYGTE
jgi:hypothetical protein